MEIAEIKQKNIAKRKAYEEKMQAKQIATIKANDEKELRRKEFAVSYEKERTAKLVANKHAIDAQTKIKIDLIKSKMDVIDESQTSSEVEKLKSSLFIKYIDWSLKRLKSTYEKAVNKIQYKIDTAKVLENEGELVLEKLSTDYTIAFERLVEKKTLYIEKTSIKKLEIKKESVIQLGEDRKASLTKRENASVPSNLSHALQDKWKIIKSKFIFGQEIDSIFKSISANFRKYSMYYILVTIIFVFYISTDGLIVKPNVFSLIIESYSYMLIIGLGVLLVIVAGYIDLSVGSLMGFMGATSVIIFNEVGNIYITTALTVFIGMLVGVGQGFLIGYLKIPAFIVTLGGMLLFQGFILMVTNSMTLIPNSPDYVDFIMGSMPDIMIGEFHLLAFMAVFSLGALSVFMMFTGRLKKLKYGVASDTTLAFVIKMTIMMIMFTIIGYFIGASLFGLSYYYIYIGGLIVLFIFITQNTTFGRSVYAIGGNKKAAELSGIDSRRVTLYVFMITGALVGFASIVFTAVATVAGPTVSSAGYELNVISSVFVGGASAAGGIGTVPGTVIGALVLGYINYGMATMNYAVEMQRVIRAIILLSAVGYDVYSNRKIG